MEQRIITNKYKNIQFYESKYVSSKRHDTEFELINEKKYDYVIKHSPNETENKDISNGSRNNELVNNKYNNINNRRNNNYNNSFSPNAIEGNNYNNDEYNNGGNLSYIQNKNNNNQNNKNS